MFKTILNFLKNSIAVHQCNQKDFDNSTGKPSVSKQSSQIGDSYQTMSHLDTAIGLFLGSEEISGFDDIALADFRNVFVCNQGDTRQQEKELLMILNGNDIHWKNGEDFLSKQNEEKIDELKEEIEEMATDEFLEELRVPEIKEICHQVLPKVAITKAKKSELIEMLTQNLDEKWITGLKIKYIEHQ